MDKFTSFLAEYADSVDNVKYTANGAKGFAHTNHPLVDFNFKLPTYRVTPNEDDILEPFLTAFNVGAQAAIRYLFYMRDVRGGAGERRTFLVIMKKLLKDHLAGKNLLSLIPEYGRWKDLLDLYGVTKEGDDIISDIVVTQFVKDIDNKHEGKPISLLAKWMPSVSGSRRKLALKLAEKMNLYEREYRIVLSAMRRYLKVVEVDMSANNWSNINYSAVPSKANIIYKDAFLRHDEARRNEFLASVAAGKDKINGAVNFPCDIVHKYFTDYYRRIDKTDDALEALWKSLPKLDAGSKKIMTVIDTSGSMYGGGRTMTPIDVAMSIGIYFSEQLTGPYANKAIVFSSNPHYLDFTHCNTLRGKINEISGLNDCSNTDIEKTFRLILGTAVENKLTQAELPDTVLVISDMDFDNATYTRAGRCDDALFVRIQKEFEKYGYTLPKLAFWNVSSVSSNTIPLVNNKLGVTLVSGYSTSIAKMVLSTELNPYKALLEQISAPRYDAVDHAFFMDLGKLGGFEAKKLPNKEG